MSRAQQLHDTQGGEESGCDEEHAPTADPYGLGPLCTLRESVLQDHVEDAQNRALMHLRRSESLGRDEIDESHELQHETHRQLFRGRLECLSLQTCIDRLNALVPQVEEIIEIPSMMPRALQKRSTVVSGKCAASLWRQRSVIEQLEVIVGPAPAVYPVRGSTVRSIALSPCGNLCCAGTRNGNVFVYDTNTGKQGVNIKHGTGTIHCVAVSRCGGWVAAASNDGTVGVFRVETWDCMKTLRGHSKCVYSVGWTHSRKVVSGSSDKTLRVWDADTGECLRTSGTVISQFCYGIGVSQTGIFTTGLDNKTIQEFDIDTLDHVHSLPGHTDDVSHMALAGQDKQLVSCSYDKTVKIWSTVSRTLLRTLWTGQQLLFRLAVSQQRGVVVVMDCNYAAHLLKLSSGERVGTVKVSSPWGVALSPCGRWVEV